MCWSRVVVEDKEMLCLKIAFVLFDLGDSGTHRSALNLAKGFRDKGFEVDLLVIHGTVSIRILFRRALI